MRSVGEESRMRRSTSPSVRKGNNENRAQQKGELQSQVQCLRPQDLSEEALSKCSDEKLRLEK